MGETGGSGNPEEKGGCGRKEQQVGVLKGED